MERHVTLLGILAGLWGALAMLVGVSMLLLSAGALAELLESVGTAVEFAAGLTAGALAIIGVFCLLYGGAHVLVESHTEECARKAKPQFITADFQVGYVISNRNISGGGVVRIAPGDYTQYCGHVASTPAKDSHLI